MPRRSLRQALSSEAVRDIAGFVAVAASLLFVGLEIRQNTVASRAAAYQEIGFNISEMYRELSLDPDLTALIQASGDSIAYGEMDSTARAQVRSHIVGVLRMWETVRLQVDEGLLDETALVKLGFSVNPKVYWPYFIDAEWETIRAHMSEEFGQYLEATYGLGD